MITPTIDGAVISSPALSGGIRSTRSLAPAICCIHFAVSLNEEHVFIDIDVGERCISLGERVHHYNLLLLARLRLDDARRGIDVESQGWIDVTRLSTMLGLDASHLNIQLFRGRKHLAQALPELAGVLHLTERRRGEIRFGSLPFRIARGASVEAEFMPAALNVAGAALIHVMRGNAM